MDRKCIDWELIVVRLRNEYKQLQIECGLNEERMCTFYKLTVGRKRIDSESIMDLIGNEYESNIGQIWILNKLILNRLRFKCGSNMDLLPIIL
jgi:hypothetical protein